MRDEQEFHAFASARMDRWRRSAFLLCQDWHTADDLVSMAAAKLFRHWRRVRAADNPDAYAQRILTRTWLDEQRRPWRRERPGLARLDEGWSPPDRVTDRDSLATLLRSLGPRQRAVLVLRFYLDYSVEDTAKILGMSEGSVKSHSARGLANLRGIAGSFPF